MSAEIKVLLEATGESGLTKLAAPGRGIQAVPVGQPGIKDSYRRSDAHETDDV
jgi:hypothetical protein